LLTARSQTAPTARLIDEAGFYRVTGKFGVVFQVELLEDSHTVGADGLDAERQLVRNVGHRFA
jgi:hypothetical protein